MTLQSCRQVLVVGALNAVNFQFRVPVDDEHTLHYFYTVNTPGVPVPHQDQPVQPSRCQSMSMTMLSMGKPCSPYSWMICR